MSEKNHYNKIAIELSIQSQQVEEVVLMLNQGATIPFISRYRKEKTGSLDEVQIGSIRDRIEQLRDLDKRKTAIIKSLKEQEKWTKGLDDLIFSAETMAKLEDIYLPYKPKRKTRASIAREKELEPLAKLILDKDSLKSPLKEALAFIQVERGVNSVEEALQGARDIIAEWINEDSKTREEVRKLYEKKGLFKSKVIKGKEEEGHKYKDYFEWEEKIADAPSHRVLALRRAEKEMIISLDSSPNDSDALEVLERKYVLGSSEKYKQIEIATKDSYGRLLKPSMETEIRMSSKHRADLEAIKVFSENLRELLMSAPLGQKTVLGIDPGFRTGCKVVVLDKLGNLIHNTTIYPHPPQNKTRETQQIIENLCEKYKVEAIAIGNGTAGRETEAFIRKLKLDHSPLAIMVNESGASIYSASEIARKEFPDHDITVRGSVSIGRRLMDPLAELVKLDPKSIGVGQYQHDVDQNALKAGLDDVVMSCVNAVGVEVNTASQELLSYVSGLGKVLAKNIVEYRKENGSFRSRKELLKVPRLGKKAYEQAAGFLRISNAKSPLDGSAVHPERYTVVEKMANDLGVDIKKLMSSSDLRKKIKLETYTTEDIGLPTLKDILEELEKPGRDPREQFESFSFTEGVNEIQDLKIGMKLPGIVTNVTNFGAFVDLGVHQDGLVHVSHVGDKFVKNPADVLRVNQKVETTIIDLDINRKRISLSLKSNPFGESNSGKAPTKKQLKKEPKESMEDKLSLLKNRFK